MARAGGSGGSDWFGKVAVDSSGDIGRGIRDGLSFLTFGFVCFGSTGGCPCPRTVLARVVRCESEAASDNVIPRPLSSFFDIGELTNPERAQLVDFALYKCNYQCMVM